MGRIPAAVATSMMDLKFAGDDSQRQIFRKIINKEARERLDIVGQSPGDPDGRQYNGVTEGRINNDSSTSSWPNM